LVLADATVCNEAQSGRTCWAYAPGHLTGFFEIRMSDSSLLSGSIGAGICLKEGVVTETSVSSSDRNELSLLVNGSQIVSAPTCESVFEELAALGGPVKVVARQRSRLLPNFGYAVSGASALSLGLALGRTLCPELSAQSIGQIAHKAEVEHLTGLGDVSAQLSGGFELRERPGAPGVGGIRLLPLRKSLVVVSSPVLTFPTKTMITDNVFVKKINARGKEAIASFLRDQSAENFMVQSRLFWEGVGIINEDILRVLKLFESAGVASPSAKKGVVFGFVEKDELKRVLRSLIPRFDFLVGEELPVAINDPVNGLRLIISEVSKGGARAWE